ncbi:MULTISPECIES: UDP-forming cellulose synthase catalytic subunit [Proteus]|jgi:cellulose synthase (UDP-forming)|uniref:Cellulose synthase catalytic subunit [UDP-forming] n=2 Tax=Proteus vulgaris TaxID=585 RepID=A0A379F8R7_PROVU|nr:MULTISPECIES: UDP-forming cellulose synthase catalytic subunit [Proteus]RNT24846.1 UDP-forming cellulose synthase catalytic subunit [Proteus mirabilis]AYY82472.1 UDP-forming cellulose synthase catalytic subunit [Proteus vulgaris]KGA56945.1 cellulose synthase catalytic subunit [Proteus vulgaris]MBG5970409.1 UDP-forming cellulose synthase catalytic subunit [Proteus vulgaris]MBG5985781.1 UDP-forming cellulose synthase catalytic subunit [Proteus vulgaris]
MNKVFKTLITAFLLITMFSLIVMPMSAEQQYIFGIINILLLFVVGFKKSKKRLLTMVFISLLMSTRYLYWRATNTLNFNTTIEAVLGSGLFMAEIYSWVILVLGYFQTSWPLNRKIAPLPKDISQWPTVDIYIPTYNESLDVVRDTVLAAQAIDYPQDKMKVYILDDGSREEFKQFAGDVGVTYIEREVHDHAKAGNLNHAMGLTDGELICVFDCDHISTRIFLQATVGSFLEDPKLALIQTPHYFYSPDPFERNLSAAKDAPHEGALFYGPVQRGNDNWNATFFCGSCAVMRRSALEEIGGIAVETVTEDAHTALKLQRLGWNSAFIDIPLAAGLATERLALHVNQRIRWARGMTQIFRVDNPMLGRGLTFPQRLCYLNAMLHFQYGLPRIIFLTAPLLFMLFNLNIIASSASMIFAYALPHLIMSVYVNSKNIGKYRYSFWGEIYETVMAFSLVLPTLLSLVSPKLGKFNVTDKGDLLDKSYMDYLTVRPLIITALLLITGISWVVIRYLLNDFQGIDPLVIVLNLTWATYSLFIILASIAVGKETRQIRKHTRINAALPITLYFDDGAKLSTTTEDISMGGVRIAVNKMAEFRQRNVTSITLNVQRDEVSVPVEIVSLENNQLRLEYLPINLNIRRKLVRIIFGRADAWIHQADYKDKPFKELAGITRCIFELFFGRRQKVKAAATRTKAKTSLSVQSINGDD